MTRDETVDMFAACALQGLLASPQPVIQNLDFRRIVDLAAQYGEAMVERLDNGPQAEA